MRYSFDRWRLIAVTFYSPPCIPVGRNDPPSFPQKTTWSSKYPPSFPAKVMNKELSLRHFQIQNRPETQPETRKPHDPIPFPRWWNVFPVKVIVAALWEFSSALRKVFKNFLLITLRRPSLEARTAHNFGQRQFCKFSW